MAETITERIARFRRHTTCVPHAQRAGAQSPSPARGVALSTCAGGAVGDWACGSSRSSRGAAPTVRRPRPPEERGAGLVAAPHRDARAAAAPPAAEPEVLPLVTGLQRSRLGTAAAAAGVLAVLLVAGGAPAPLRAPVVLIAALLLPGFPLVARLRVDLPTLVAVDVCT